jgi:hypothetical protein
MIHKLAGQHPVTHNPKAKEICSAISQPWVFFLLWCGIIWRSDLHTGNGHFFFPPNPGEAKVDDLDPIITGKHQVKWLYITMDNSGKMQPLQPFQRLDQIGSCFSSGDNP